MKDITKLSIEELEKLKLYVEKELKYRQYLNQGEKEHIKMLSKRFGQEESEVLELFKTLQGATK